MEVARSSSAAAARNEQPCRGPAGWELCSFHQHSVHQHSIRSHVSYPHATAGLSSLDAQRIEPMVAQSLWVPVRPPDVSGLPAPDSMVDSSGLDSWKSVRLDTPAPGIMEHLVACSGKDLDPCCQCRGGESGGTSDSFLTRVAPRIRDRDLYHDYRCQRSC